MPTRHVTINGHRVIDPRSTHTWKKLVKQVLLEEPHCWLQLDGCTGASTTGDHVIPVTTRPELALIRSNIRGACRPCNDKRGNLPIAELNLAHTTGEQAAALTIFD